jgi:hypothetical protein
MEPSQFSFGTPQVSPTVQGFKLPDFGNTDYAAAFSNWQQQQPTNNLGQGGANIDTANVSPDFWSSEGAFGGKNNTGWLTGGAQALSGLAGIYTGLGQLDLAKDSFNFQRDSYNTNLSNQTKLTNDQLIAQQEYINRNHPDRAVNLDEFKRTSLLPSTPNQGVG